MTEISSNLLKWRKKQRRGAIMKPDTFDAIVQNCMDEKGWSKARCEKVAGRAYWNTAKAKFQKSKTKIFPMKMR